MISDLLTPYKSKLAGHAELRFQKNGSRGVGLLKGNITSNYSGEGSGLSARVYKGGFWGFASGTDSDERAVDAVLSAAEKNAEFLTSRLGEQKPPFEILPAGKLSTLRTEKKDVPQRVFLDYAKEVDNYIAAKYPGLTSRSVSVSCDYIEKSFVTSDGADGYSLIPRTFVYCSMTAQTDDGAPVNLYQPFGGPGFFPDQFSDPALLFSGIDKLHEKLMKKREGIFAKAGICDVILDAKLAGILAHEAIGHTVEADLVLGGSVAGPYLNKPVASELVTLVDFANTANGTETPQPIYVDDEGTIAKDAVLIKDGVLVGYMHNRESAAHFGHSPTGNARAHAFSDEPLIRMRNTAILPGKSKLEDMIASIDDGYYLIQWNNGQADLTSEFMFGVVEGYEIKKGKLESAIRDTTISGVAFDVLKTITMLSDDMDWTSNGMCGKKQPMPTGMGGPAVKCRVNIGGR
ncbi:MAG: TldD/PmbA family protein [Oscillospiraceae bacterium]|nr:TldD/PmbA family protein [Oscillospiraceae bacterium]